MSSRWLSTTLTALVVAAVLVGGSLAEAGEAVPFKGEVTATFVEFAPPNIGIFRVEGRASHMGKLSGSARVYFTPLPKDAELTLVAANGDAVYLKTHGEPNATGAFVGTYQVTGGTGRFEGATGGGAWISVVNADETVTSTWKGDISY